MPTSSQEQGLTPLLACSSIPTMTERRVGEPHETPKIDVNRAFHEYLPGETDPELAHRTMIMADGFSPYPGESARHWQRRYMITRSIDCLGCLGILGGTTAGIGYVGYKVIERFLQK